MRRWCHQTSALISESRASTGRKEHLIAIQMAQTFSVWSKRVSTWYYSFGSRRLTLSRHTKETNVLRTKKIEKVIWNIWWCLGVNWVKFSLVYCITSSGAIKSMIVCEQLAISTTSRFGLENSLCVEEHFRFAFKVSLRFFVSAIFPFQGFKGQAKNVKQ